MTTVAWIVVMFIAGGVGWLAHGTWNESRHDCLPHHPEVCRDTTGETR